MKPFHFPDEIQKGLDELGRREQVWNRAAEKHLFPKPGTVIDLAIGARAWRILEATQPNWREQEAEFERKKNPSSKEITDFFTFKKTRLHAKAFEQQYKKALLEKDRIFARRLSQAWNIPDDRIISPLRLGGSVLLAYDQIIFEQVFSSKPYRKPTKREIRLLITTRRKKANLRPISERSWGRIWRDELIAALLNCP